MGIKLCVFSAPAASRGPPEKRPDGGERPMATPEQLVLELIIPEQRENALLDLSKVSASSLATCRQSSCHVRMD